MTLTPHLISHCLNYQVIPLKSDDNTLTIAVNSACNETTKAALRFLSQQNIEVEIWPNEKFNNHWQQFCQHNQNDWQQDDDQSVIKFISQIIELAVRCRASDIHFEPYVENYRIRLRIDGVLQQVAQPPLQMAIRISTRIKIMAKLNIAEKRLPQDGQINQPELALRVSTIPVHCGEKIVLRLLENQPQEINLDNLGFTSRQLKDYLQALHSNQGLILVTGPTGSGKSMTLYSGLQKINNGQRNICSVEDPIEIPLNGINQSQINPKAGLLFSNALRALLRQDPDVLMIGEIRDQETANIAIEAAQTGHLVLSTLHTNSTFETLTRLQQMGIASYLLAAGIKLIIAQRLVRCLCQHCRKKDNHVIETENGSIMSWSAEGCSHCLGGYHGRTAIYELLVMNEKIQQALLTNHLTTQLKKLTYDEGITSLKHNGLLLAHQGITSLDEIYRVLDYAA